MFDRKECMKIQLLAAILGAINIYAAEVPDSLIQALIQIESNGNDLAVGDVNLANPAFGCLQIRQPCVTDVNRKLATNYRAEECLGNRGLSIRICREYLNLYATEKRVGHKPTLEDYARIWNGGPNGFRKTSTEDYWRKVKRFLKMYT